MAAIFKMAAKNNFWHRKYITLYIIVNIGKLDGQTCINVVPIDLQGIINIQDCQKIQQIIREWLN